MTLIMHERMTITLDATVVKQFRAAVPAKQRSQYIEDMLRKALRRAEQEAEYEAMSKDPAFLAEEAFFMDFNGDVGDEPW